MARCEREQNTRACEIRVVAKEKSSPASLGTAWEGDGISLRSLYSSNAVRKGQDQAGQERRCGYRERTMTSRQKLRKRRDVCSLPYHYTLDLSRVWDPYSTSSTLTRYASSNRLVAATSLHWPRRPERRQLPTRNPTPARSPTTKSAVQGDAIDRGSPVARRLSLARTEPGQRR